jgi:threonine dehydrogenase-like Zn-dependent dehydrogenase
MKALVDNGPRNVSVSDVPDPRIDRPTDAIVQITTTNICGSDLRMYEGCTDMETNGLPQARWSARPRATSTSTHVTTAGPR